MAKLLFTMGLVQVHIEWVVAIPPQRAHTYHPLSSWGDGTHRRNQHQRRLPKNTIGTRASVNPPGARRHSRHPPPPSAQTCISNPPRPEFPPAREAKDVISEPDHSMPTCTRGTCRRDPEGGGGAATIDD